MHVLEIVGRTATSDRCMLDLNYQEIKLKIRHQCGHKDTKKSKEYTIFIDRLSFQCSSYNLLNIVVRFQLFGNHKNSFYMVTFYNIYKFIS